MTQQHSKFNLRLVVLAALPLVLTFAPAASAQLRATVYVSGLRSPVGFVQDPSDSSIQYVVEQGGVIWLIQDGARQSIPFLDISGRIVTGGEKGLVGLAFPPDYATSHKFYVYFTRDPDG